MKIIHIITSLEVGGAEKLLVNVANKQCLEHDVTVVYFKVHTLKNEFNDKIEIIYLPFQRNIVRQLRNIIRNIKPNVVHTHLTHADLIGHLAMFGFKKIKRVTTIHNNRFKFNYKDKFYYLLYFVIFNLISRKTRVIAISKTVYALIYNTFRVSKERVFLVYNTVSETKINDNILPVSITANSNKFKILFVGRLTKQKSVHTLIEAINLLPLTIKNEIVVYIVGDGELRGSLEKIVEHYSLTKVVFFEGISANVAHYYKNTNLFVLPSVFEGFGMVILEAFKFGLPVVASNIDGPAELIKDGDNGFLCEVSTPNDFTEKITYMYENEDVRDAFSSKALKVYESQFSLDIHMQKLYDVYLQ